MSELYHPVLSDDDDDDRHRNDGGANNNSSGGGGGSGAPPLHPNNPTFSAVPVADADSPGYRKSGGWGSSSAGASAEPTSATTESSASDDRNDVLDGDEDCDGDDDDVDANRSLGSHSKTSLRSGGAGSIIRPSTSASSPLRSGGGLSRNNSLDEWDDLDEDEAGLRRYHMDFSQPQPQQPQPHSRGTRRYRNIPLPAEFGSWPSRLWHSFMQLRSSARQRRAARLLTMPSESFQYKLHACLVTWCCDATDRGILLVAGCVAAWLLVGWVAGVASPSYWWGGVALFVVRVSARRVAERVVGLKQRQRRSSIMNADDSDGVFQMTTGHHRPGPYSDNHLRVSDVDDRDDDRLENGGGNDDSHGSDG